MDRYHKIKSRYLITLLLLVAPCMSNGQIVMTIDKALEIAEKNSPQLNRSKMNLERSEENLFAKKASLKSKVSLDLNPLDYNNTRKFDNFNSEWYTNETIKSAGTLRIDQPILFTDGTLSLVNSLGWQDNQSRNNDNTVFSNNLYLELSQPIFTYNRTKMELEEIQYDYENAYIEHALQRLNTEMQITNQFYSVFMAQNNLIISKEELTNSQTQFNIIENKVEADLSARDELFQAELNLATAQSLVDNRQVTLDNLKDKFKQLLGIDIYKDITTHAQTHITPVHVDMTQAIDHGLSSRLELRQREIELANLDFAMTRAKASDEFKGDIALSLGIMGENPDFHDIYQDPTRNPRISIRFSVPIFDWGERKARIRAQEIAKRIGILNYEDEKIEITLEIRKVCRNLANLYAQIQIADKNVSNAQLMYDLNMVRYSNGDLTGMEINQFQTQLSNKKVNFSQSQIDYKIELLNLKILSLYDFENNTSIVPSMGLTNKNL